MQIAASVRMTANTNQVIESRSGKQHMRLSESSSRGSRSAGLIRRSWLPGPERQHALLHLFQNGAGHTQRSEFTRFKTDDDAIGYGRKSSREPRSSKSGRATTC
jgi:hypothetical protein